MSADASTAPGLKMPEKGKAKAKGKGVPIWRRSPSLVIGAVIVLATCVVAAFPSLFTSQDPLALNPKEMLLPPSPQHLFGTDNFGYDVFTRVIYATRLDLLIGVASAGMPFLVGSALGLVCGYYGGKFDAFMMRVLDVFMAFPFMVLAIAIVAILGNGVTNLIIAMWVVSWPPYTRLVRAEVLIAKGSEYVQAARTLGYSDLKIMFRHILPNVISSSIVYLASDIVMCIMSAATLSFLGLGVQPPAAEWGDMLGRGRNYIFSAPHAMIFPGLAITVTVLAFNLLGDGIRDAFDPKSRNR